MESSIYLPVAEAPASLAQFAVDGRIFLLLGYEPLADVRDASFDTPLGTCHRYEADANVESITYGWIATSDHDMDELTDDQMSELFPCVRDILNEEAQRELCW